MPNPKTLRGFTLFVDGIGYAGRVTEGTPPKLTVKTEEFAAGGMSAPLAVDTGSVEKIEFEATLGEMNPALLGLIGQENTACSLRAAQGEGGTAAEAVVYTLRARLDEVDPGSWKPAGATECKTKFSCSYYKLSVGGVVVHEIDPINCVRVVNGTDQMASIRDALAL